MRVFNHTNYDDEVITRLARAAVRHYRHRRTSGKPLPQHFHFHESEVSPGHNDTAEVAFRYFMLRLIWDRVSTRRLAHLYGQPFHDPILLATLLERAGVAPGPIPLKRTT